MYFLSLTWWILAPPGFAHNPHDPVAAFDVSPDFAADGLLFGARVPAENWRTEELIRSDSRGVWWEPVQAGLANRAPFADFRLSPDFSSDSTAIATALGAWVSRDGGRSWTTYLPGVDLRQILWTRDRAGAPTVWMTDANGPPWCSPDGGTTFSLCDPGLADPVVALAAAPGALFAASSAAILTSDDDGGTWTPLALPPATPLVLAAAADTLFVGTDDGLWFATPPYDAYTQATGPTGRIDAIGIAPGFPADPVVLAGTATEAWASADGGATFERVDTGLGLSEQSDVHYNAFRFTSTFDADRTVFLMTFEGLLRSTDAGKTWAEFDTRPPGLVTGISVSPDFASDATLCVSTYDAGLYLSTDGGDSFAATNLMLPTSSVYDVVLAHDADGALVITLGENDRWVESSVPGTWTTTSLGGDAGRYPTDMALSPAFDSDGIALIGTRTSGVIRTADAGDTWTVPNPVSDTITAMAFSWGFAADHTVWAATDAGQIHASTDDGATWALTNVSFGDLPRGDTLLGAVPDGGWWVGTAEGLFFSFDGESLAPVDEPALATGRIDQLAVAGDGTVFASAAGAGLYRQDPGGAFTRVGTDLAAAGLVPTELAVSPAFGTDGTVFAAVGTAVIRSTDRGESWHRIDPSPIRYEESTQAFFCLDQHCGEPDPTASASSIELLDGLDAFAGLSFYGTGVDWIGGTDPLGGTADVYLDDVLVETVVTVGPVSMGELLHRTRGLPAGVHEIRVVAHGDGTVWVDAFDVALAIPADPPGPADDPPTDTAEPEDTDGESPEPSDGSPPKGNDTGCGCGSSGAPASGLLLALVGFLPLLRRQGRSAACG